VPGLAYIRQLVKSGALGKVLHLSGRYWTDYGCDPQAPMTWRYRGPAGSGALADIGSHLSYVAEFIAGPIREVRGGSLSTVVASRPLPLGSTSGHEHGAVADEHEPVENDDVAAFSASFADGATGTIEVSRVAAGHPTSLILEVFCSRGAAYFDQRCQGEIGLFLPEPGDASDGSGATGNGYRKVILGPGHPYLRGGLAMDAPGTGFGQNDAFAYQARAFLEEIAGVAETVPRCASFQDGLHNMEVLSAVTASSLREGRAVAL
jgi:predicted dehydrogenase